MKILGPAIIDRCQQIDMQNGAAMILVGRDRVFADAADRARIGDVWWTKEPFFDVQSKQFGCPTIHELVPGYGPRRFDVPEYLKPWAHKCRWKSMEARQMVRGDSRFSLVITEITAAGFRCAVHKVRVDDFAAANGTVAA